MGLDTDDIVALSIDIPLICIAIILVVAMFFMESPKVMKALRRELIKAQTNTEERHKSLLEIVVGHDAYVEYLNKIQNSAIKTFNSSTTGQLTTYQEQYLLDEDLFNSKQKPVNPSTLKEYTWEEWEPLAQEKFIYDHLYLFIRPSSLYHAIQTRIEAKKL